MPIHKDQRVGVFVDVQNLYYSAKQFYNAKVNFAHILKKAVAGRSLIRAIGYVIKADIKEEHNFFEALEKIGFDVRAKDLQTFYTGAKKGDWDVGIAMDIMRMASKLDVIVLVSGDGDFKDLLEHVKALGCRAEVIAFGKTASSRLTNEADDFHDLGKDLEKVLIKDSKYNPKLAKNTPPIAQQEGVENVPYQRPDGSFEKQAPPKQITNNNVSGNGNSNKTVINDTNKTQNKPNVPVRPKTTAPQRPPRFERKPPFDRKPNFDRKPSYDRKPQRSFERRDNFHSNNDEASFLQRINMDQPDLTKTVKPATNDVTPVKPAEKKTLVKKTETKKPVEKKKSSKKAEAKKPAEKKAPAKKESVVEKVIKKVTGKQKKK